ncbi:MAG: DUF86 domain-containing protein [Flavobacteriales bacterium]|nr:DUF86 domain-containing protein [Flavobacteriales bacterium]
MDRVPVWLEDILVAIDEIEQDLPPINDFNLYKKNRTAKRAIERNLEIIGEAMSRVLSANEDIEITDARKIVNLRNQVIHGYDSISDEIIYTIATRYVPKLKLDVEKLMQ